MRHLHKRRLRLAVVVASAALALTACGSGSVSDQTKENEDKAAASGGDCGEFKIITHPWVGYTADAYVVGHVAQEELGCNVEYVDLKEGGPSYQAMASGDGDVILEEWSHEAELKEAVDKGSAVDLGSPGNVGIIGWYVPGWLAEEHPDILDYKNLNKYASDFATSESGGQGQFLGADPSYVQFDEAIVSNLDLDFKVVFSGSEAASIEAFRKAEENKEFLIGYFYEPQYFMAEVPLVKVALPPYEEGCQDDPQDVACDYPETELKKIVGTDWAASDSTAVDLVQNFTWTNEDQNVVAGYIASDGMSPEDAAAKWIDENQDKVDAWLG